MLIGRDAEKKQLEEIYASEHNNLVVLYGRRGIGKTVLAQDFMLSKPAIYYKARECTEKEQIYLLTQETMYPTDNSLVPYAIRGIKTIEFSYLELFESIVQAISNENQKVVVVIDEFQLMTAGSRTFVNAINDLLSSERKVMFLFLSSSINWVENDLMKEFGTSARCISSLIKLEVFPFTDIVECLPKSNVEQCIFCNAAIGGIPKYLKLWQDGRSVKDNLIRLFFQQDGALFLEAEHFLKMELRELKAYNTILAALALGKIKLTDIYDYTGFSRAKISVYIKNLIQLGVVEKIYSFEIGEGDNSQKGLYRIKDNYINFWYRFVYPNLSEISLEKGKNVYEKRFLPEVSEFMRVYFADVCEEFLKLLSKYKKLSHQYVSFGKWYGKSGFLDIVGTDEKGNFIVGLCTFDDKMAGVEMLKSCKEAMFAAGITLGEIYLFAKNGFTKELRDLITNEQDISLIELKDL